MGANGGAVCMGWRFCSHTSFAQDQLDFFQDAGQLAEWKEAFNLFDKDKVKHAELAL